MGRWTDRKMGSVRAKRKRSRGVNSTGHINFRTNLRGAALALETRPANSYTDRKIFIRL